MATTYFLVSWVDHRTRDKGRWPPTREYGTATSKQAAIRLAEPVLPPGAEYVVPRSTRPSTKDAPPRWTATSDEDSDRRRPAPP
jgi:hypothetical protein